MEEVIEDRSFVSIRCRVALAALSAVSIAACRPLVMTPAASKVAVATAATEVEECKPRGKVFALAPFRDGQEPLDQLKMRADVIGADTLLVRLAGAGVSLPGEGRRRRSGARVELYPLIPAATSAPRPASPV